jgi:hypothetical protein
MRTRTIGMLAVGAIAVAGCGGSSKRYANEAPPPTPVNVTVFIDNARVSISPNNVGAGPVTFIVANHATSSESLQIQRAGFGNQPLADTGPINPQGTASVNVNFSHQGQYTVSTGSSGTTEASTASPTSSIAAATLTIGSARANSRGDLNLP